MSNENQYPELPSHLVWWNRRQGRVYVVLVPSELGVAWAERSGKKYRCTSAPHDVTADRWVEQFAETKQEAINLIHTWAVLEVRNE